MNTPIGTLRGSRTTTAAKNVVVTVFVLFILGCVGLVDYLTGREFSFGIFYFLPIWLITWQFGRTAGVLISLLCALVWFAVDAAGSLEYSTAFVPYWNASVR